ncbi:HAD-like domain-containing protein [Trichoderma sp. SZMC 28014]
MKPTHPEHPTQFIYFDLDGTLFDHDHALRNAISAIHKKYNALTERTFEELMEQYGDSLAYDEYLDKVIPYEEADTRKVQLFFETLGLPQPGLEEVQQLRDTYRAVYRANRRPTAGSVEVLVRLREHGYLIGIITNGQVEDETDKVKAIGILPLINRIITSEEAGYQKPDPGIFRFAIKKLGLNIVKRTYMIGDSASSDVKGALDAAMAPIMYDPAASDPQSFMYEHQIPVINHMAQLLVHLDISSPQFTPQICSGPNILTIAGIGIDMVTEPQRSLHMSKLQVQSLAERMGNMLECMGQRYHKQAVDQVRCMIGMITMAADFNDETTTRASGRKVSLAKPATRDFLVTVRDHSTRVEYMRLTLPIVSEDEDTIREIISILQEHCHDLMRDDPNTAIHRLLSVDRILNEQKERNMIVSAGRDRTKSL